MPEPLSPFELEESLKNISTMPEPDSQFVNSLRARFITQGHVIATKNKEIQMKQNTLLQSPAWAIATIMLTTFVVILSRFTMANTPQGLSGPIPDGGVVEQTSALRMLMDPVKIAREGTLVTVEQAVLSSEKTVIVYSYQYPNMSRINPQTVGKDSRSPVLVLPDGARLEPNSERKVEAEDCSECDVRYWVEFNPVPADVDEAVLELPGLAAMPVGQVSQIWKIQLKFKPADPSDIPPVIQYPPSPTSTEMNSETPTKSATQTQTLTPVPTMIYGTQTSHPVSRPPFRRTSTPTAYVPATPTPFPGTLVASPTSYFSPTPSTATASPTPVIFTPTPWKTPSSPTPYVGNPTPGLSPTPWITSPTPWTTPASPTPPVGSPTPLPITPTITPTP